MENSMLLLNQVPNKTNKIEDSLSLNSFFLFFLESNFEVPTDILANFGDEEIEEKDRYEFFQVLFISFIVFRASFFTCFKLASKAEK